MASHDPDHVLMARIGQRDMLAYRELVGRHLGLGVRVAERMLGNRQDAEDVMQDACLKIWREADRWQPKAKFTTWLYRVVINACIDRKRKILPFAQADMESFVDERLAADAALIAGEEVARVRRAMQHLPQRQRAALILSYYEELSNQEAANVLGVQLGAFQQLLFRAKQNLKQELKDYLMERPLWMTTTN